MDDDFDFTSPAKRKTHPTPPATLQVLQVLPRRRSHRKQKLLPRQLPLRHVWTPRPGSRREERRAGVALASGRSPRLGQRGCTSRAQIGARFVHACAVIDCVGIHDLGRVQRENTT